MSTQKYRIKEVDLFMRETPSPRMDFFIGKGKAVFPKHLRAIVEARLILESAGGSRHAFGCSADWPSVGWLDKRPDISAEDKLAGLLDLVEYAAGVYRGEGAAAGFASPFAHWRQCSSVILDESRKRGLVDLSAAFASSLIERAMIDAVCRLESRSFLSALRDDVLQIRPGEVHADLKGIDGYRLPEDTDADPSRTIAIRHTVGLADPLAGADLEEADRVGDGEPETLEEYIRHDRLTHFKVKISGDADEALDRMARIWAVLQRECRGAEPVITLDCNEAYADPESLESLVVLLGERQPDLFARILLIEQPLPRSMKLDAATGHALRRIAQHKPLIIDEGDGVVEAFHEAQAFGFTGVSHKNCKGVYKSLLNRMLCQRLIEQGTHAIMSAEDLTHMPVVSLHQDFAVVAALGLRNAERNGHHYFYGLSHLTEDEKRRAKTDYPGVYTERNNETFLNIQDGSVDCGPIVDATGFGVATEPDWNAMMPLRTWRDSFSSH